MTRDDLIEKVAAQISTASFVRFTPGTYAIAEAAIDIVLEEAARQCEGDFDSEMLSYGKHFAAAIRALKSGGENE